MPKQAIILGINSVYHDSSAAILKNGVCVAMAEEERFTRIKHAKSPRVDNASELPWNAIEYCLKFAGVSLQDVQAIGYSINPTDRLKNCTLKDDVEAGGWGSETGEKQLHADLLRIPELFQSRGFQGSFHWLNHHNCHAASAYYVSPFNKALTAVIDGIGETDSASLYLGKGNTLQCLKNITYPASLGFLWEKICLLLGFRESDACKVMGMAAYGNPNRFKNAFEKLVQLTGDGSFQMNNECIQFRRESLASLQESFDIKTREKNEPIKPIHMDIAAALQQVTEDAILHVLTSVLQDHPTENLCLAGGVALNCVVNQKLIESRLFKSIFYQPVASDAGTALGAALLISCGLQNQARPKKQELIYLGPGFDQEEIEDALQSRGLVFQRSSNISQRAAELIAQGNIVAWFQDKMEAGPRALGNRSLLADPRNPAIRDIINLKTKHREFYRPFAASVMEKYANQWFEIESGTNAYDYMLATSQSHECARDHTPAILHVDKTSRIQIVKERSNPKYHALLSHFHSITQVPMVLNTSFNDQEPIVCTPSDAIETFLKTQIDVLAIGDYVILKSENET